MFFSDRNQLIDLHSKSIDWLLYEMHIGRKTLGKMYTAIVC